MPILTLLKRLNTNNKPIFSDNYGQFCRAGLDNEIIVSKAASYDIYRDDEMIISINSFTYIDTGLSPETNYTYYIKARIQTEKNLQIATD